MASRNTADQKLQVFDCFSRCAVHLVIVSVLYLSARFCDLAATKDILTLFKFLGSVIQILGTHAQDCNRFGLTP